MASLALEEEAMLQAALDASIADVQGTARHILSQPSAQHTTFREDLSSPASWPKDLASGPASRGVVEQIGIVNQFSEAFRKTIDEFGKWQSDRSYTKRSQLTRHLSEVASSICGYVSCATALEIWSYLCEDLAREGGTGCLDTLAKVEELTARLRDFAAMERRVRDVMAFIRDSRLRYIAAHATDFPSQRSREVYLKAWVANYEISDYLQRQTTLLKEGAGVGAVPCEFSPLLSHHLLYSSDSHFSIYQVPRFLRFNQWPEYGVATHEEKERLVEERRFGGKNGDKEKSASYGPNDSQMIVESFVPERLLERPEVWARRMRGDYKGGNAIDKTAASLSDSSTAAATASSTARSACIFVLDLNGHFAVSVSAYSEEAAAGNQESKTLFYNSTKASYADTAGGSICLAAAHDLGWNV
jgi:hypothetical protein